MIKSLMIGAGGIVCLMLMWVTIQFWWRKMFSDHLSDDDVLAGRTSCSNCGCTKVCERKNQPI
jgi:hypothetical protein